MSHRHVYRGSYRNFNWRVPEFCIHWIVKSSEMFFSKSLTFAELSSKLTGSQEPMEPVLKEPLKGWTCSSFIRRPWEQEEISRSKEILFWTANSAMIFNHKGFIHGSGGGSTQKIGCAEHKIKPKCAPWAPSSNAPAWPRQISNLRFDHSS